MALGASQLNFSRLSKNQQVNIEIVKIVNIFEEVRNNSLIWRGVWTTLDLPELWRIQISQSLWTISSDYTLNGSTWLSYENWDWNAEVPYTISNITCSNLDNSTTASLSWLWTFTFDGSDISFSWTNCNNTTLKRISFDYGLGSLTGSVSINTLSGVIEAR